MSRVQLPEEESIFNPQGPKQIKKRIKRTTNNDADLVGLRSKIKEMLSNKYYKNNFDIAPQDEDDTKLMQRLKTKRLMYRFPVSDIIVKDIDFYQRLLSHNEERTAACRSLR